MICGKKKRKTWVTETWTKSQATGPTLKAIGLVLKTKLGLTRDDNVLTCPSFLELGRAQAKGGFVTLISLRPKGKPGHQEKRALEKL